MGKDSWLIQEEREGGYWEGDGKVDRTGPRGVTMDKVGVFKKRKAET